MRYWLSVGDGQTRGPFTTEQLIQMRAQGSIGPSAQLCPEGSQQWAMASDVLGMPTHPPIGVPAGFDTTAPVQYAGFGARWAAAFIDGILVYVANLIVGVVIGLLLAGSGSRSVETANLVGGLVGLLIGCAYSAGFEASAMQATLGKRALGIKVTTLDGGRISIGQGIGRHFGKLLSGCLLLIGYLMMLWDPKKQTLHDRLAGTLVVKR